MVSILMVAEKPSIATSIAQALSSNKSVENLGKSPPCYEFYGHYEGKESFMRITSVTGHVYSTDFPPEYQSWDKVEPVVLFNAPIISIPCSEGLVKHLERMAKGIDLLILWLDCDREGENICFEVIRIVEKYMNKNKKILRAKFSAVTPKDIEKAMLSLTYPNENESKAVEARQELDLKVGVAFSRFQTIYFRGKYGDLDSSVISYGPCQTPTLGFCVDRHDEIQSFTPETFYTIDMCIICGKNNIQLNLNWNRQRIFDQQTIELFYSLLQKEKFLTCISSKSKEDKKVRPKALNTVELLKIASKNLGIGPHAAMKAAEHLYLSGYLSYPRTESTSYPKSFDFKDTLHILSRNNNEYSLYAKELLTNGYNHGLPGHDAGDHPPITPVGVPNDYLSGDNAKIYNLVVKHFLASISNDATYMTTKLIYEAPLCKELFNVSKSIEIDPGYLKIYDRCYEDLGAIDLPDIELNSTAIIHNINIKQGKTSPPGYLTESELISLMEQNGIGTDASIPTHINNILIRNYVTLGPNRTLIPTTLGNVLVHGYKSIDPDLVFPSVRAAIETFCDHIAKGLCKKEDIIQYSLNIFQSKFIYFMTNIIKMDSIFEASFSPIALTGKFLSKCGKCSRYMRYIPLKPQRLYCPNCEEAYNLPQNGTIKLYKELKCPLDNFELVFFSLGNTTNAIGKSYPLCPYCYNHPPSFHNSNNNIEDISRDEEDSINNMGCNSCKHPSCKNSSVFLGMCECPGANVDTGKPCPGNLILDVNSKPNWKLACNCCNTLLRFKGDNIHDIKPQPNKLCNECGVTTAIFEFNKLKTPLKSGETTYSGCIVCDDLLNSLTELIVGRSINIKIVRQNRLKHGGGRGGRGYKRK